MAVDVLQAIRTRSSVMLRRAVSGSMFGSMCSAHSVSAFAAASNRCQRSDSGVGSAVFDALVKA